MIFISAFATVEDFAVPWQGALTRYCHPDQMNQGFFYEAITPPPPPFLTGLGSGCDGV